MKKVEKIAIVTALKVVECNVEAIIEKINSISEEDAVRASSDLQEVRDLMPQVLQVHKIAIEAVEKAI